MPFVDVIDDYSNGATGSLTTASGASVGYTVTGNAPTVSLPGTDLGAEITADGSQTVTVTFDQVVTGVTVSINRSNSPEVYFVQIDGVTQDLNTLIANGTAEFTQTGPDTHEITAAGGLTSSGSFDNGSIGFVKFLVPITSISVFGTGGTASNFDLVEIGIDSVDFQIVCFALGTPIATPDGPKAVEALRKGDLVITSGGALRAVVGTNRQSLKAIQTASEARLGAVRISAGALGKGLPLQDIVVSRQHRVLVASRIAARICGETEVLIPAFRLVGIPGITLEPLGTSLDYVHVLLDRHDILLAAGAPAESLFLGPQARGALGDVTPAPMRPARLFPSAGDTRKIVAAHAKHNRPLLECYDREPAALAIAG